MPGKHIYAIMTGFAFLIAPSLFAQQKLNNRNMPIVDSAVGVASYYADKFIGRKTASGEIFSQHKMTCAHNTLPFGTKVKVTNLRNGKSIIVRVNDRLHHRNPRIVDLPTGAAKKLGYTGRGIIKVSVVVVKPPVIKPANAD
ncbi:MAG: septal ring lytic transglycosylase RlpA family protein [Chitinophagaceae bacterium]